jgi:hypothetical protein
MAMTCLESARSVREDKRQVGLPSQYYTSNKKPGMKVKLRPRRVSEGRMSKAKSKTQPPCPQSHTITTTMASQDLNISMMASYRDAQADVILPQILSSVLYSQWNKVNFVQRGQ